MPGGLEVSNCVFVFTHSSAAFGGRRGLLATISDGPTASLYFLSALYCSALPPRCIFLHICLWPRRQWSCWQVALQ